jgi:dCMP deaminase
VVHAELNAILNAGAMEMIRGSTLYVALFPCNECSKALIQAGVRRIVYCHDYYHDTMACHASRTMLNMAGIEQYQYTPTISKVNLML